MLVPQVDTRLTDVQAMLIFMVYFVKYSLIVGIVALGSSSLYDHVSTEHAVRYDRPD